MQLQSTFLYQINLWVVIGSWLIAIPPFRLLFLHIPISRFESKAVKTQSLLKNRPHFRL